MDVSRVSSAYVPLLLPPALCSIRPDTSLPNAGRLPQFWPKDDVFALLVSPIGHVGFEPPLEDSKSVVLSVLEAAVLAAMDLPRITPASTSNGIMAAPAAGTTTASNNSPNVIPSTGLDAQLVEDTMKVGGGACSHAAVMHQHSGLLDGTHACSGF